MSRAPLAAALAVALAACGAEPTAPQDGLAPEAPAGMPSAEPARTKADGGGAPGVVVPVDARKRILNASFDVAIADADAAVGALERAVGAAGGFVGELSVSGTREDGRVVHAVLRVPSAGHDAFTTVVRGLGEVRASRLWSEDVTEAYVDLEERIRTKALHLERLQGHLAGSGEIEDLIALEAEIGRVTSELEAMRGRMRVMADQVDLATFELTLFERGAPQVATAASFGDRLGHGFAGSAVRVVEATGDLVVGLTTALPWLAWAGALGALALATLRGLRRLAAR